MKIELPTSHTVTKGPRDKSWMASATVDVASLTPDIVAKLAVHGLQQKIADAAAGATNEAEATAAMQKAIDALVKGEWTSRTAGEGVSETVLVARMITRSVVKAKYGAKSPEWAAFTGLEPSAQNAKLDEIFAANAEKLQSAVDAKIAERAKQREERKSLSSGLDIAL
jgi:hypothetical protein